MSYFCVIFLAIVLLIIVLFALMSYFYMTKRFKFWQKKGVKEIPPVPFFGSFCSYFFSETSPGIVIKNFYDTYQNEPYVGFYSFNVPCLLIRDPEIIKKIFITDFELFSDKFTRSSEKDELSNKSLPFLKNPEWKCWRTKLTPAFSPKKIRKGFPDLQIVTKEVDHYLDSYLEGLGNVDIEMKEFLSMYTTDIVGLTGFGLKLNSFHPDALFRKFAKQMFGEYGWRRSIELACIFLAPHFADFFNFRFVEKISGAFFKKEFEKILRDREDSKKERGDFADLLLQIKQNDNSINFEEMISQAIVFFNAGCDTTSIVMTFVLKELAENVKIQKKLRRKINAVKGEEISYKTIKNLPYLEMVVLETLRLHPTVPTIDRIAGSDYIIKETGLQIEKGTPIFISLLGLHYDSNYFKNPHVFDPERFSKENNGSRNPAYMPFGIGPRKCIAYQQGLMQVKYGIATIISKYEVTLSSKSPEKNTKVYFTGGKEGVYLNIRKI